MKPLNGENTHPLTEHSRRALASLKDAPAVKSLFNPGVVDRLLRGGLVEIVMLRSPFKKDRGRERQFLQITDEGRKEAGAK